MTEHNEWPLLSAYLDGELSVAERASLEHHLGSCPSCKEELAALAKTKRWAAGAPRRALPPDLLARLDERLSRPGWRELLVSRIHRPGAWLPVGAAAALALAFAVRTGLSTEEDSLPLEPLLAAHSRYAGENLIPTEIVSSNFSAQLAKYHGEQ